MGKQEGNFRCSKKTGGRLKCMNEGEGIFASREGNRGWGLACVCVRECVCVCVCREEPFATFGVLVHALLLRGQACVL